VKPLSEKSLSDAEVLRRLAEVIRQSRRVEADLVFLIGEVDARKLYAPEAVPSTFAYCTEILHLSEPESVLRIRVARGARDHPVLLTMLREGRLHLSGIALLAPLLTPRNRTALLKRATHRSKEEIKALVAELTPRADAPATMRKLPEPRATRPAPESRPLCPDTADGPNSLRHQNFTETTGASLGARSGAPTQARSQGFADRAEPRSDSMASVQPSGRAARLSAPPARPATVEPLAAARYKVQFTADAALRDKLQRLKALMRSSVPDGDLGKIIDEAVTEKLQRLEAKRFGKTRAPRKSLEETDITPSSRHVPAAVRRAVHARDGGRCTYVDTQGRRCRARDRLEFHHHGRPFGRGGDHSVDNIRLMCATHNALQAERDYGKEKMARHQRAGKGDWRNVSGERTAHPSLGGEASRPP
jgi:hypothetical protein